MRHGLTMLAAQGRLRRMQETAGRLMTELNARGLTAEAAEIARLVQANRLRRAALDRPGPARKQQLPAHCPSCGAAVHPDEVEWLDDLTAECAYCGSPLRGEA